MYPAKHAVVQGLIIAICVYLATILTMEYALGLALPTSTHCQMEHVDVKETARHAFRVLRYSVRAVKYLLSSYSMAIVWILVLSTLF
jgi:hypothetical protein